MPKAAKNAGKKPAEASAKQIDLKDKYEDGEMDLSMCDLQDVPVKNIATFKKMYSLDLSNNRITILPKNFATLTSLVKLDLSKNQLKELPENFGELSKLKHLDLYKNALEHLPLSFSKLQALKWLDLKDNRLMPKIAQVAGPCLDAKQCQTCAKNIVSFYSRLDKTIQEEKDVRQKQREKSLKEKEENAQKQRQQAKHAKKKQKQAAAEKKSDKITQNGGVPETKTEIRRKPTKPVKRSWFLRSFCYFVALLVFLTVGLFIATSLRSPYTKNVEKYVGFVWKICVDTLPAEYKPVAVDVESHFKRAHSVTGQEIGKLFDKLFKK